MESTRTLALDASDRTKISSVADATSCISQAVSSDCIKTLEAAEFCSVAEAKSKDLKNETKVLTVAKNESLKVRDEFMTRNKTNATNWENWVQTKYELDKLKCDLKAEYIMADEAAKTKRLKYIKTISSYKSQWESTENEYKKFPEVVEFIKMEKQNEALSNEIDQKKNLFEFTVSEYIEILEKLQKTWAAKMMEFAKEMVLFKKLNRFDDEKREKQTKIKNLKDELSRLENLRMQKKNDCVIFFEAKISQFDIPKEFNGLENNANYSPVDITAFDNISIPAENLETHNDDDLFIFSKTSEKNITSEAESALQSDVLSDNSSEGEDSQTSVLQSQTENNEPQNQYLNQKKSQYFQSQNQNQQQGHKKDGQLSQHWSKQREGEIEQGKGDNDAIGKNKENDNAKAVKPASKRTGQRLAEEPQPKIPDLGDKPQQNQKDIENDSHFEEFHYEDDRSYDFEDNFDAYSGKSFESSEGGAIDKEQPVSEDSFQPAEIRNNVPVSPPSPPVRQPADSRRLDIFSMNRTEEPASSQPFSFNFNNTAPTGSSIFNLF